ncbi:MAG TPA: YceI family protein [Ferruginibacter sp.]|nr:YceI family protein [Ferruginibacter sp.]HRE64481.1 YceI family protein [Ferruginibacter sp.]
MKKTTILFALIFAAAGVFAQAKKTTSATVSFDASTEADPVAKAENKTVIAVLNTKTGAIGFEAAVKNFAFENKRVEEHFNAERWLNSGKFPTFAYKGKVTDITKVNFKKDGTYAVTVEGELTVKETTKPFSTPATITVKAGKVSGAASFSVNLPEYGVMADGKKVSKDAKVSVAADFN